uniref:tRNA wybutosine-synthesizing protein 3 homolog n=1 Tax=Mola mola TaxID=94237 RepID=A0A3Q3XRL2_MOLML
LNGDFRWKKQCLNKLDLSKKGSVDEDITHVVSLLNSCEEFFTTSSCSGRIILIDGVRDACEVQKQNCVWLFVSHQKCTSDESNGDAVFKFEPFVLHVQCRQLDDAQLVHSVAINSGFRNSGLTVSKTGKIMTAVRSTHGLEVPLSNEGKVLVEEEYIHFLTRIANQKIEENLRRIQRSVPICLLLKKGEETTEQEEKNKPSVYQRRRKREKPSVTDCCHGDGSSIVPELDDCLDLFT